MLSFWGFLLRGLHPEILRGELFLCAVISSEDSAESSDGDEFPEPSTSTPGRITGKEVGEQGQGCRNLHESYCFWSILLGAPYEPWTQFFLESYPLNFTVMGNAG